MKKIFVFLVATFIIVISLGFIKYVTIGKPVEKYNISDYLWNNKNIDSIDKKDIQLTFLSTSSFIFEYKGKKLLTDPFFSNPEFLSGCIRDIAYPDVKHYLNKTLYENIDLIVISHGHYDHCLDIKNFLSIENKTNIIAEKHIANEIASVQKDYLVQFDTDMSQSFRYSSDSTFRVMPIKSSHSPHFAKVTLLTGNYTEPLACFPDRLHKWKLHECYSYIIDVLDKNKIIQRTVFICGEQTPEGIQSIEKLCKEQPADLLLNIYWKDKICEQTLYNVYDASKAKYVLLHHWNNFFKDTKKGVEVLRTSQLDKAMKTHHKKGVPSKIMMPLSSISF